ncbi:hypothetical protein CYMTET_7127 [Cymbomonas tetramitiformis]|uniref:Uncharacterized protein n=1 Tax=Cymbomonas tetramitiformis TaxID=36881 RepID=A0AAE0LHD9_9CHLO|nr:hypothetical protein CYMTET_7127 [Cymbomonas tetramitiformis]
MDSRLVGNEANTATLFTKLVPALQEAFTAEDTAFTTLFTLDDATVTVRVEPNRPLFCTLKLLVHPASPAADWLEVSSLEFLQNGKPVLSQFARRLLHSDASLQGTSDLLGVKGTKQTSYPGKKPHDLGFARASHFGDDVHERHSADDDFLKTILSLWKEVKQLSDRVNAK